MSSMKRVLFLGAMILFALPCFAGLPDAVAKLVILPLDLVYKSVVWLFS